MEAEAEEDAEAGADEDEERPFDGLEPAVVLGGVESFGLHCDGHLLALNSFENRVYQVGIEGEAPVVAKFYRPGRWSNEAIEEEHAFARELAERDVPVVAPLPDGDGASLREYQGFRVAIFPRFGGRWPDLETTTDRELIGRFLGRLHAVGRLRGFEHRPSIGPAEFGQASVDFLLDHEFIPFEIEHAYVDLVDELIPRLGACFDGAARSIRLHGDFHRGNVLWNEHGAAIVDLDDCRTGPAVQDLWMLLAGSADQMRGQLDDILNGYRLFDDFDARELALIEPLRTLRLMYHAAWIARRWNDPAFPIAFTWFDTPGYWTGHLRDLEEQSKKIDSPPLAA